MALTEMENGRGRLVDIFRCVAFQATAGRTSRIFQHTVVEAQQAEKESLGWKWTPRRSPVGGGTVGGKSTGKIYKAGNTERRAPSLEHIFIGR